MREKEGGVREERCVVRERDEGAVLRVGGGGLREDG